jgi:tetratricopeptide (TPR) repeat protein
VDPSRLSADYTFDSIPAPGIAESWVVFLALLAMAAAGAWRSRPAAFGLCLFAIPLLFVSNVVPIYSPMADRHFYFPMVGLGMLAATGFGALLRPGNRSLSRFAVTLAAATCLAFAFGTFERQKAWESPEALFLDTITKNPRSFTAHGVFATALVADAQKEKALHHTLEAIRLMPDGGPKLPLTAAKFLLELGRKEEALAILQSVEISPGQQFIYRFHLFDYALLHDLLGNKAAARAAYSQYLTVVPEDPRALNNLAWILATDPRSSPADRAEALSLARRAMDIDSSDRLHSGTLAVALIVNGDTMQGRILAEKSIALSRAAGDEKSASLVEAWLPKANPPAIIKAPAHKK